jgi:membrane protease YdiL (CAAX protease family)
MLLWQLVLAMWLVLLLDGQATPESLGFKPGASLPAAFAVGVAAYALFVIALTAAIRASGAYDVVCDGNFRAMASIMPRSRRQQVTTILALCVFNPVTEELLYRGILVHQLAIAIDSLGLALLLGLAVTLGNHAYQGLQAATTHLPFYLIAVALLYSPWGMAAAIAFHFAGDVFPTATLRNDLGAYRQRHRARRAAFADAPEPPPTALAS